MSGFTKLHSSILDSTIWREANPTRILFITLLAMADKDGVIEASIPGLADRARLSMQETIDAIATLESPDQFSRSPENDGRRIYKIDGGWALTNYAKYRDKQDTEARREYLRVKQAEHRAKVATSVATKPTTTKLRDGYLFFVAANGCVKIGFSVNPWARLSETKKAHANAEILAIIEGNESKVVAVKECISVHRIQGDWFRKTPEVLALIDQLTKSNALLPATTTNLSTTSTQAEAEAEADTTFNPKGLNPPAEAVGVCDGEETGIDAGDLAAMEEERQARASETASRVPPADLALVSEDDPKGKDFPWRQVMGALARIVPEVKMPTKGDRRDVAMKNFWRKHNKTVGCFELLAQKVRASDYLMARNGHKGQDGKPYSWGWIFGRNAKNECRADVIMDGGYSTDAMAFVLEVQAKATAPKMTKVMAPGGSTPFEVNLAEIYEGEPRYKVCDTHPNGMPVVIDYKG